MPGLELRQSQADGEAYQVADADGEDKSYERAEQQRAPRESPGEHELQGDG
jgi:hypothetical protein